MILTRSQATGANYFLPGGLLNGTNLGDYPDFNITSSKSTFDLRSMFGGPLGFSFDCGALSIFLFLYMSGVEPRRLVAARARTSRSV